MCCKQSVTWSEQRKRCILMPLKQVNKESHHHRENLIGTNSSEPHSSVILGTKNIGFGIGISAKQTMTVRGNRS